MRLKFGLLGVVMVLLAVAPGRAQQTTVRVGWSELPPYFDADPDGQPVGLAADLLTRVAVAQQLTVDFVRSDTRDESVRRFEDGEIDVILAPPLSNELSGALRTRPFVTSSHRLFVRTEDAGGMELADFRDRRVGFVPPATSPAIRSFLKRNVAVAASEHAEALLDLLSRRTDGMIGAAYVTFERSRRAGLDHKLTALEGDLQQFGRTFAVRADRPDLHTAINEGLRALAGSGELAQVEQRLPALPNGLPDQLVVGLSHFPPYITVAPDGTFSGFATEVLRDLAERLHLNLRFQALDGAGNPALAALAAGRIDLTPQLSITDERQQVIDFTVPIDTDSINLFVGPAIDADITDLQGLADYTIGTTAGGSAQRLLENAGHVDVELFDSVHDLAAALAAGKVPAAAYSADPFEKALELFEDGAGIRQLQPPLRITRRGIALRTGLGQIREALNSVLPAYLTSDDYQHLRAEWFGPPEFWTRARIAMAFAGIAVLTALLVGLLVWQAWKRRKSERAARDAIERAKLKAVAELGARLQLVLNTASNGIIALDRHGQVLMANPAARHMLGGISGPEPFAWPDAIRFLNIDDLKPLEASADPIRRALAGQILRAETNLMTRRASTVNRYVRVNSALVEDPDQPIRAVIALDDVSVEEKNRQQAERSGRLDALGQLTGGIAHDFNNLLAVILGALDLLRIKSNDPALVDTLDMATGSVKRGAELTKRLLAFAKRQPGLAKSHPVGELLYNIQALVKPTIEASIYIDVELEEADLWVFCDPGQLENALLNLIINARDAIIRAGHRRPDHHQGAQCRDGRQSPRSGDHGPGGIARCLSRQGHDAVAQ